MRGKKWTICLGALLLAAAAVLAVLAVGARNRVTPEKVQRAATARKLLMDSVEEYVFSDYAPEYLVGRFINEDCRLQIRLHESAREQEAVIREALGEYADVAVFSYVPLTFSELQGRTLDIERVLRQQGYSVTVVWAEARTGNIRIGIEEKNEIAPAAAWVAKQKEYPIDVVGVELIFDKYADMRLLSMPAKDTLEAWLKEQGGYKAYKDYYCGNYMSDMDGKLHVVLKEEASMAQKAGIKRCLRAYSAAVVYEYGGYPEEEVRQYMDDLYYTLSQLGLGIMGGGVDAYNGQPVIGVMIEDVYLAHALLEKGNVYPFGNEKYTVIFETVASLYPRNANG